MRCASYVTTRVHALMMIYIPSNKMPARHIPTFVIIHQRKERGPSTDPDVRKDPHRP